MTTVTDSKPHQSTLAAALRLSGDAEAETVQVTGAALDSRDVESGDLFMAVPGERAHGVDHVHDAETRGAAAIAWDGERAPETKLPMRHVANLGREAGAIAAGIHGAPSESLLAVGVTGTDGKTTCAWLLAHACSCAGLDCGYIGTLGAGRLGALHECRHTTPDAAALQRECARLRDTGAQAVGIEVSSHALAQNRTDALHFDIAVLTGIGRDHLDYHASFEQYVAAKRRLFDCPTLGAAVINADDAYGHQWLSELGGRLHVTGYGVDPSVERLDSYVHIAGITPRSHGLDLTLSTHLGELEIPTRLLGFFNAANVAAVVGVLIERGLGLAAIREMLADVGGAPGRMERVDTEASQPTVVVDYAHTAGALTGALTALDEHRSGRLIVTFGCGGERDTGKRAAMGRAASAYADLVIVTDDNPRRESPEAIVDQIVSDLPSDRYHVIHDRAAAISEAIGAARSDDIVLIAGKGHESSQQVGETLRPFDDREIACKALEGNA